MRNYLKGLELDSDVINDIMKFHGELEKGKSSEIDKLTKENERLTQDIETKDKEINELKDFDIEAVKKEQFDLGKVEGSKDLDDFKKNSALEKALSESKVKDSKIIKSLLDSEKLTYEEKDGDYTVVGLNEQLDTIKKSHDYLFETNANHNQQQKIDLGGKHTDTPPNNEPTDLLGSLKEKFNKQS